MLKFIFYTGATLLICLAALVDPLMGVIAVTSSYLWNPAYIQMDTYGMPPRFELVTSLAFIAGWLLHRPRAVPRTGTEMTALFSMWAFIVVAVASAAWAQVSYQSALDKSFEVLKTILIVTLMVSAIRSERQMTWLVNSCLIGLLHASFMHTFGHDLNFVGSAHAREYGVLSDTQSAVEVLFLPLMGLLAMRGTFFQKVICWGGMPIVLNSLIESYQRTYFVAVAVQVAVLALFLPKRLVLRLAPVGLVLGGLVVFVLTPQDWWERMQTISAPTEEGSAYSRFVIAEASIQMFLDYPVGGVGYRNYPRVSPRYLDAKWLTNGQRSAHNSFFSILCETGFIGFTFWIFAFLRTLWTLRTVRKRSDPRAPTPTEVYAMGFEVGIFGWFAAGMFNSEHETDPAFWLIAIAIVLVRLQAKAAHEAAQAEEEVEQPKEAPRPRIPAAARVPALSR